MHVLEIDPQVFASYASLLVAMIAIGLTVIQLKAARKMHNESTAKGLWREYLQNALNHPDLASPDYTSIRTNKRQFEKYEWYVSAMLYACEEILDTYSINNSRGWAKVVKAQLEYHASYLTSSQFEKSHYNEQIQFLIEEL